MFSDCGRTSIRAFARLALVVSLFTLAVLLAISLAPASPAQADTGSVAVDESAPVSHPVSARVATQVLENGRFEFCIVTEAGERVCPRANGFHPDQVRSDRWIASSEVSWSEPFDSASVSRPARTEVPSNGCQPDFERMFRATWRVDRIGAIGTAFHIGEGRFVTAHHVIEGAPPVVLLRNGTRSVPAAVLGSVPEVDAALLEVYDHSLVADVPAVELRAPTSEDAGRPTYLVGYPAAGPLTVSLGGVVTRVWEDQIETDNSSQGGNSGGPMFDACGDVLGVLWAGNRNDSYSHAAGAVTQALESLEPRWPALPTNVPRDLRLLPGWLIWHWDSEPPAEVDCSAVDGDFFVGYVGPDDPDYTTLLFAPDAPEVHYCSYGQPGIMAVPAPRGSGSSWSPEICVQSSSYDPLIQGRIGLARSVLHDSRERWGEVRLTELHVTDECPHDYTHQLAVRLTGHERGLWPYRPSESVVGTINDTYFWQAFLIDSGGRRLQHGEQGFVNWDEETHSLIMLNFEVPDDFDPVWIEVRTLRPYNFRFQVRIEPPEDQTPTFEVRARIAALVDSESGRLQFCLLTSGGERLCPETNSLAIDRARPDRWYRTSEIEWRAPLDLATLPHDAGLPNLVGTTCALGEDLARLAWQVETITAAGTAVYIGQGQFLTDSQLLPEDAPWAVVAQGDVVVPVVRVATDVRNGLALVELLDPAHESRLGSPVRWAVDAELVDGATHVVVGYPDGDPRRFTLAPGKISEISERSFRFPTWAGIAAHRVGAPIIDPCSRAILGISLTWGLIHETSLRASAVARSIAEMRAARKPPPAASVQGPALFGASALWPQPVYVSTEQPYLGGLVCNVRSSERYDHHYAVYLVSDREYDLMAIRDGNRLGGTSWTLCPSDKVLVVVYRSDRTPDTICIDPPSPDGRLPGREVDWVAPPEVALLQFSDLVREPCPGHDRGGLSWPFWESDLHLRVRISGDVGLDDITLEFRDAEGQTIEHTQLRDWSVSSADPDELAWRINLLTDAEPATILVSLRVDANDES